METNVYDNYYTVYKNYRMCIRDYRKYKLLSEELEFDSFVKSMQGDTYVKDESKDTDGKDVCCLIFYKESAFMQQSAKFKTLLFSIKNKKLIIIVPIKLRAHHNKVLYNLSQIIDISCYDYIKFAVNVPIGPHCGIHRILTNEEKLELCNKEIHAWATSLPRIKVDDPQAIWIGAKDGDIIKIESPVNQGGIYVKYRIVIPSNTIKPAQSYGQTTMTQTVVVADIESAEESDDDEEEESEIEEDKIKIIDKVVKDEIID